MDRRNLILAALASLVSAGTLAAPAGADPRHCPPGLARRNPPCAPPGQARRRRHGEEWGGRRRGRDRDDWRGHDGWRDREREAERAYREGYRDGYRVARGDRLRRGEYRLIENPDRYGLHPYRGADRWRYYLVRDTIVRADPGSRRILDVLGLVAELGR